jgi:hypothetical protein
VQICHTLKIIKRVGKTPYPSIRGIHLALNPKFSVEEFAIGDDDPEPYGQDVMVNPDLQIVLQFIVSADVADFAFQLQNVG